MSGYYIGANTSVDGIRFAPTLHATYDLSPRVALRGSVAYQRSRQDREESSAGQQFVQHKVVHSTVVPLQLQVALNPAQKFRAALLGGLTLRYSDINDRQTYYYSSGLPSTSSQDQVEQRLDVFLAGGLGCRYQATPRWSALADGTVGLRLGSKTVYYELLPSAMLLVGVGYSLGRPE
ncbi:hypothetical protein GCM10022406_14980 [Hymenobacter algoricola]|uniref:Outer membrane protein beta-barrel domain-containing protein n=2 Tax=Hymenobacter algoricola TaxID=486267 RepID=A0ABP7MWR5_9BACT